MRHISDCKVVMSCNMAIYIDLNMKWALMVILILSRYGFSTPS